MNTHIEATSSSRRSLDQATALTRARYDRLARVYDRMEAGAEMRAFGRWRADLWERVRGPRVLELGVGTGKNMPHYRSGWQVTGLDLSPRMLEKAERLARQQGIPVRLVLGDAQSLPFPDGSFDTVAATFVFCSVPDPVQGLREAHRVLVPNGQLLLLEHVLSNGRFLRQLMRLANPLVVRLMGANINRRTLDNVREAGFELRQVDALWRDIVTLIEAGRPIAVPSSQEGEPISRQAIR